MTNPNDPKKPHQDALSALENLANGTSPATPAREDSVDASGFVGMLARGTQNEADPAGSTAPPPAMRRPMPQVSPKAVAPPPPSPNQLSAAIPVAKEIMQAPPPEEAQVPLAPPADAGESGMVEGFSEEHGEASLVDEHPEAPAAHHEEDAGAEVELTTPGPGEPITPAYRTPPGKGRMRRRVPHWYHTAVPISFTVGALLFLIGVWALLAVLSSMSGASMAPGFDPKDDTLGMPLVLLTSLPVGIALEIMAIIMTKQLRRQADIDGMDGQ